MLPTTPTATTTARTTANSYESGTGRQIKCLLALFFKITSSKGQPINRKPVYLLTQKPESANRLNLGSELSLTAFGLSFSGTKIGIINADCHTTTKIRELVIYNANYLN